MKRIVNSMILTCGVYTFINKQSSVLTNCGLVSPGGQEGPSFVASKIPSHDDGSNGAYKKLQLVIKFA